MKRRGSEILAKVLSFTILALLIASCAPAAPPAASPAATPTKAAVATPAAAPAATPTKVVAAAPAAAATPVPVLPTPGPSAEKPRYGGVIGTGSRGDLTHYDLHQSATYLDLHALATIYSLLVRSDFADINKLVPDLAERWEVSSDGKVYTFYLRRGVKWHDGSALTSADVKASFERIAWPPKTMLSHRQAYFDALEKIETPDNSTVKFVLTRAQASFPAILSVPFNIVFPKALLDKKPDMKRDILGSGPFKLKEYMRGAQFAVVKNPDYYIPGRPYLDGITRYIIPDPAALKAAFVTDRMDLLQPVTPYKAQERVVWKKQSPQVAFQKAVQFGSESFIPNLTRKPWGDIRVRRAMMLAMDKDALLELLYPDQAVRGGFIIPGPWATPTEQLLKLPGFRKPTAEDVAEAKRLLAEAGYPKGFTTTLLLRSLKEYFDMSIATQDQLAKVGITANLDAVDSGIFQTRRAALDYDAMSYATVSVEMGEPDIMLSRFLTGSPGNTFGYSNPKFDELYRKQSQTMDIAERKKLILEIERMWMEEIPYVPWYWKEYVAIVSPRVKGFLLLGLYQGHSMEDVWLTQ